MKGAMLVALVLLAGCAGVTPMEQLEANALLTGDWSQVERRERMLARRNLHSYMQCPPGTTGYCETSIGEQRCGCLRSEEIRSMFIDH